MHRCLYISDILPNICDYVMQDGKNESRAAVAYLAQTCSCFYEPAMNTLWRTLNSLVPLFFCLPKETWKMNEDGRLRYNPAYTLLDTDWDRFIRNSRRVRTLRIYDDRAVRALEIFALCCPTREAFHSLTRLEWNLDHVSSDKVISFMPLLGPNLVEISSGCSNEFITAAFLSMAEQRCRGLRKLEVSGARISYANSSVLQDVVERVSTSFPVLQTLFCLEYQPSAPSLLKLSCSRTLRTLDISLVNPESMVDLISASSEVHLFPVLRCLGLYFITELPILLLQASRFARLKVLFIHGYVKASASEIQQFLAAISGFKSLRSLHMEIVQEIPIESPSIAPLLTLHNLRTLTIWYLPLSLPDDYTEKMISAWPSIRHLEISIPGFVATLLALRAFGRR